MLFIRYFGPTGKLFGLIVSNLSEHQNVSSKC